MRMVRRLCLGRTGRCLLLGRLLVSPSFQRSLFPFLRLLGFVESYCRAWWHRQMQPSSCHSSHLVSARLTVPQCSHAMFGLVDLFGYPLCDG